MSETSVMLDFKEGPDDKELPSICPKCGAETIFGYGLAFGGIGTYVVCDVETCDFVAKQQDKDALGTPENSEVAEGEKKV